MGLEKLFVALGSLSYVAPVGAQQLIGGVEPNQTKWEATPAFDLTAGDSIWVWAAGLWPNVFRVRTAPLPLRIYRHELRPTSASPTIPRRLELLGNDAVTGTVYPQSLALLQSAGVPGSGHDFLAWYGFGKAEELYVDMAAIAGLRYPTTFSARLSTGFVPEVDLGAFPTDTYHLRANAVGVARDLELHVFDSEYNALPWGRMDEPTSTSVTGLTMAMPVNPGVYHVAVADHAAASHVPPNSGDLRLFANVLDFAGGFVCDDAESPYDVELSIGPQYGAPIATATARKILPYEVLWFRVQIGTTQSTGSFCPADGSVGSCGCLGDAPQNSAMGCRNTSGRGATLIGFTYSYSAANAYLTLVGEDLPPFALALAFAGLTTAPPTPAGAGLLCLGPGALRLGTFQANAAGTTSSAAYDLRAAGFLSGQTVFVQAAYRDPLASAGCVVNLTSGFWFLVP
jgi:hypothetical protein